MKPKKSPPAKGQGTLFSFFSKKEPTSKPDQSTPKAKPKAKPEQSAPEANTEPSTPTPKAKAKINTRVEQPKPQAGSKPLSQEPSKLVGKRIKVFWRDDNNWYFGKVVDFSDQDGMHLVHYDDGDKEKLMLHKEKVSRPPR